MRRRGFTLIELLVVIVIIGIIAAMATLSVGTGTSRKGTEKEVQRIQDLLALGSEEAVLQSREFGLTFYEKEYEFSFYDAGEGRWKPLDEKAEPFVPRKFPPETVVDLELEGRLVKLAVEKPQVKEKPQAAEDEDDKDKPRPSHRFLPMDDGPRPQVFMLSSGDITPFKLRLRPGIGTPGISLKVDENGKVEQIRDAH